DAPPIGWGLVGFFLAFGMFFIISHYLFEWDMSEKWVVTGMATVVTMLAVPFLFNLMLQNSSMSSLSRGANNEDAEIDYALELGGPQPLKDWLAESSGRIFGSFTRGDSEDL